MKINVIPVNEYHREYNLSFCYKLPFKKWYNHDHISISDFDKLAEDYYISSGDLIDVYTEIAVEDLQGNISKMINHDIVCNKKNLNCIVESGSNFKKLLKKDFKKEFS